MKRRDPADLTPGLRAELLRVAREPQPTYGSSRTRLQNGLLALGLVRLREVDGVSRCELSEAGEARARAEAQAGAAEPRRETRARRRAREDAHASFFRGRWTASPPREPGHYPVAELGGQFRGRIVEVRAREKPAWAGWFWSRPLPPLPPTPARPADGGARD